MKMAHLEERGHRQQLLTARSLSLAAQHTKMVCILI